MESNDEKGNQSLQKVYVKTKFREGIVGSREKMTKSGELISSVCSKPVEQGIRILKECRLVDLQAFLCLSNFDSLVGLKKVTRVLAVGASLKKEPTIHQYENGTIMVMWEKNQISLGIFITQSIDKSSWYFVSLNPKCHCASSGDIDTMDADVLFDLFKTACQVI